MDQEQRSIKVSEEILKLKEWKKQEMLEIIALLCTLQRNKIIYIETGINCICHALLKLDVFKGEKALQDWLHETNKNIQCSPGAMTGLITEGRFPGIIVPD